MIHGKIQNTDNNLETIHKHQFTMKKVLLLLAEGFEILEASAFIDVMGWNLVEGDKSIALQSCGLRSEINSAFGQKMQMNTLLSHVDIRDYAALAIPGGFEEYGYYTDAYDDDFLDIIRTFHESGKLIASVCVGALPLARSGILREKKATTYPSEERRSYLMENSIEVVNESLVLEDNIISSTGPATAVDVALLLLEKLTSRENAIKVQKLMGF